MNDPLLNREIAKLSCEVFILKLRSFSWFYFRVSVTTSIQSKGWPTSNPNFSEVCGRSRKGKISMGRTALSTFMYIISLLLVSTSVAFLRFRMIISYCCTETKFCKKWKDKQKVQLFIKASFEDLQRKLFSVQLNKHINFVNKKVILDTKYRMLNFKL